MKKLRVIAILACSLVLAGCDMGKNESLGTGVGAAGGAIIGTAITGDSTGAILGGASGAFVGNRVGASQDR